MSVHSPAFTTQTNKDLIFNHDSHLEGNMLGKPTQIQGIQLNITSPCPFKGNSVFHSHVEVRDETSMAVNNR